MATQVRLPALGESVVEGTVSRWLKKVGDHVDADEPLLEVSTDKVDTEVPSPVAGVVLEILIQEDETAEVGAILAVVGEPAEATSAEAAPSAPPPAASESPTPPPPPAAATPAPPPAAPPEPMAPSFPPPAMGGAALGVVPSPNVPSVAVHTPPPDLHDEGPYVTPLVRKLAQERDVDLNQVTGSGVGGRIRKQDIIDAATGRRAIIPTPQPTLNPAATFLTPPAATAPDVVPAHAAPPAPPAHAAPPAPPAHAAPPVPPAASAVTVAPPVALRATPPPSPVAPVSPAPLVAAPAASATPGSQVAGTTHELGRLRLAVARRMIESLQTAAQSTAVVEVDVTAISRLRSQVKGVFAAREGAHLTYLPFITKATVEGLVQFPELNATLDLAAGTVTYPDGVHVGIAVDTDKGMVVPVVRRADELSVGGLAKQIGDLAARTKLNRLTPGELQGGTFTITNYGSAGTLLETPIINQPQVAILGVGALVKRPVVVQERLGEIIAVRDIMYVSLTYDHRLIESAHAARFLSFVKSRLEAGDFGAEFGVSA